MAISSRVQLICNSQFINITQGPITSNTLWIPFDLKEQAKIEASYIAKELICDLLTHSIDFQQFALAKKQQQQKQSLRQIIRVNIGHPQLKKYRPDITSNQLFQNIKSEFFSETQMYKLYLYKILIPDKQKREAFKMQYENQLIKARFNPIWCGGMHIDFIAYLFELYTTTGVYIPEFIAMNKELMDSFQSQALKYFENGITLDSLNKFIISGILKEANDIDSGDQTQYSNNWTSAEIIAQTLLTNATLANYHEMLIKITTKECFLMYQLNCLLIEKNISKLKNLLPFFLFLQVSLKIQSLQNQTLDNSPINLSNIMNSYKINQIQLYKKMNLSEQITNVFLNLKQNVPFSLNFFFTATTLIENTYHQNGNILFLINYIDKGSVSLEASNQIRRPFAILNAAYLDKITYHKEEHEVLFPAGILVKISGTTKQNELIVIIIEICN